MAVRADVSGKAALVTGAAAGIGREVAAELVRRGVRVVGVDLDAEPLKTLRTELDGARGTFLPYELDLRDVAGYRALLAFTEQELGGLDILANVAGITRWKQWHDVTLDDWEQIIQVNARAVLFLTQQAVPVLEKDGGGAVISIASIAGKGFRHTSSVAYAGSKAAVIAMSRVLSSALAPMNIRVNCLCPGPVETGFLTRGMQVFSDRSGDPADLEHERWVAQVPLHRAALPVEIADLVCFLAADTGRCITGQAWNIDGGMVFD
jgi:NAD(P)-dependent dehydrogenase (short-subunit alcohol dehydrogenase family)